MVVLCPILIKNILNKSFFQSHALPPYLCINIQKYPPKSVIFYIFVHELTGLPTPLLRMAGSAGIVSVSYSPCSASFTYPVMEMKLEFVLSLAFLACTKKLDCLFCLMQPETCE